jgi:hypothetical protein
LQNHGNGYNSDTFAPGHVADLRCKTVVIFWRLEGWIPDQAVQEGERVAMLLLVQSVRYREKISGHP